MLAEHIPVKQGLRQSLTLLSKDFAALAEHIPVKQGLRHELVDDDVHVLVVLAEHIPVKQGLRPGECDTFEYSFKTRRAYSSKTRIKTHK